MNDRDTYGSCGKFTRQHMHGFDALTIQYCKSSHQKQNKTTKLYIFSRIYAVSGFYAGFYMQKLVFKASLRPYSLRLVFYYSNHYIYSL